VTKQSFERMSTEDKLNVLFDESRNAKDFVVEMKTELFALMRELQEEDKKQNQHCDTRWYSCDTRFKKMEKFVYWITGGLSGVAFIVSLVSIAMHVVY